MWRVWLLVNPAHALWGTLILAVIVSVIVHFFVFNGPLTDELFQPWRDNWVRTAG